MTIKNEDYDRLRIMIYSMHTMQYRGISIREIVKMTLRNIIDAYQVSEDARCLDLIEMHLQAYVNMGNGLDPEEEEIREALTLIGKRAEEFRPAGPFIWKKVTLTHSHVRGMIGKWRATAQNSMTIQQVVEDIIQKVSKKQLGCYLYEYCRFAEKGNENSDLYELIVGEEVSYFYDVNNLKFYVFE